MHEHGEHGEPEAPLPPSGEGSVVLDVGGTRGAAVIFTTGRMAGAEIEIRNAGRPWDGTHTAVRQRDLRDNVAFAGVFGSLAAGNYELRIKGKSADPSGCRSIVDLRVTPGQVTQMQWPGD